MSKFFPGSFKLGQNSTPGGALTSPLKNITPPKPSGVTTRNVSSATSPLKITGKGCRNCGR